MKRALLDLLQQQLNRYLAESTAAMDLVAELEDRSLDVLADGAGLRLRLLVRNGIVELSDDAAGKATASVRGSPLELVKLLRSDPARALRETGVRLEGDAEVARLYSQAWRLARPDPEDELARWVGDLPAHTMARAAENALAWGKRALEATAMNLAEYLQEESRQVPAPLEAQAFFGDVDTLRDDVERAAQRLARLEAAVGTRK